MTLVSHPENVQTVIIASVTIRAPPSENGGYTGRDCKPSHATVFLWTFSRLHRYSPRRDPAVPPPTIFLRGGTSERDNPRARTGRDRKPSHATVFLWTFSRLHRYSPRRDPAVPPPTIFLRGGTSERDNPRARTGRDRKPAHATVFLWTFQSTRPYGARPRRLHGVLDASLASGFNPRARTGRDRKPAHATVFLWTFSRLHRYSPRRDPAVPPPTIFLRGGDKRCGFQSTRPYGARP